MFDKKDMLKATKMTTLICSGKEAHLPWCPLQIRLTGHHPVYKKVKILDNYTNRYCVKLLANISILNLPNASVKEALA